MEPYVLTGQPVVWLVSTVLGAHPVPKEVAATLRDELDLDAGLVEALTRQPARPHDPVLLVEPTI